MKPLFSILYPFQNRQSVHKPQSLRFLGSLLSLLIPLVSSPSVLGFQVTVHPGAVERTKKIDPGSLNQTLAQVPGLTLSGNGSLGNISQVSLYGLPNSGTNALFEGIVLNTQNTGGVNLTSLDQMPLTQLSISTKTPSPFHQGAGLLSLQGIDLNRPFPHHISSEMSSLGSMQGAASTILTGSKSKAGFSASGFLSSGLSQRTAVRQRSERNPYQTGHVGVKTETQLSPAWQMHLAAYHKKNRLETDGRRLHPDPDSLVTSTLDLGKIEFSYDKGEEVTHKFWVGGYQEESSHIFPPTQSTYTFQSLQLGHHLAYQTQKNLTTVITHYDGTSLTQKPRAKKSKDHGRFFLEHSFACFQDTQLSLATTMEKVSKNSATFSPQAKLISTISPEWKVEMALKRVHRFPTLLDKTSIPGMQKSNEALKPEKVTQGEATLLWEPIPWNASITFFHAHINDAITTRLVGPRLYQRVNRKLRSSGGIVSGGYQEEDFKISASYTLTHLNKSFDVSLKSNQAKHKAQATLELFLRETLTIKNTLLYYGRRPSQRFVRGQVQPVTLKSYTLWQSCISFSPEKNINLYIEGRNLLDQRYEQKAGYRTPGRSIHVGIRGQF